MLGKASLSTILCSALIISPPLWLFPTTRSQRLLCRILTALITIRSFVRRSIILPLFLLAHDQSQHLLWRILTALVAIRSKFMRRSTILPLFLLARELHCVSQHQCPLFNAIPPILDLRALVMWVRSKKWHWRKVWRYAGQCLGISYFLLHISLSLVFQHSYWIPSCI